MSYSKVDIESLFVEYIQTADDKVFGELIESCCPIIDIILSRYSGRGNNNHIDDMRQEVKLKMWKNLRNPSKLKYNLICPTAYLWFVIRAYIKLSYEKMNNIFNDSEFFGPNFITFEEWMVMNENKEM